LQLKALAEEQLAVVKGLEKVEQELTASESDGPVSDVFRKVYFSQLFVMFRVSSLFEMFLVGSIL
jgi:hypothetical protein